MGSRPGMQHTTNPWGRCEIWGRVPSCPHDQLCERVAAIARGILLEERKGLILNLMQGWE